MIEKIVAYLRDPDGEISLENLDFDNQIELRRSREKGQKFEFGNYDPINASVEITIERPDPPKEIQLLPGSQDEWEAKREWYMKHAGRSSKLLREGLCEGYIIQDREEARGKGGLDEVSGDCAEAALDMQNEDRWNEYLEYSGLDMAEQFPDNSVIKIKQRLSKPKLPKPKEFLQGVKRLRYKQINAIKNFKERVYSGKPWTNKQFIELGFSLPSFENKAEEFSYVLENLDGFIQAISRRPSNQRKSALSGLVKIIGLDKSLVNEAREKPWEVYEILKDNYCSIDLNPAIYDSRIAEIVFALGV